MGVNSVDRPTWTPIRTGGERRCLWLPFLESLNVLSLAIPHSWLITGFVTRLIRQVPLVEQKLLIFVEYLSSPPVFSVVHVTRSLVLCVMFCWSLFVPLSFFFWPLHFLFFVLRILITSFVSSNSSKTDLISSPWPLTSNTPNIPLYLSI